MNFATWKFQNGVTVAPNVVAFIAYFKMVSVVPVKWLLRTEDDQLAPSISYCWSLSQFL